MIERDPRRTSITDDGSQRAFKFCLKPFKIPFGAIAIEETNAGGNRHGDQNGDTIKWRFAHDQVQAYGQYGSNDQDDNCWVLKFAKQLPPPGSLRRFG